MKRCQCCHTGFIAERWRCPACGWVPGVVSGFPAFAPGLAKGDADYDPQLYDELFTLEAGNFWFRARNKLITWALRRHFPDAQRFLEIGCGTGFVLAGIAAALPALELAASEIASEGLPFAALRVPRAVLFQGDARALPFQDEFDAIGAFDVLEHIDEDGAVFAEMHRALHAGGGIVVTVPQHPWLWSAADEHAHHKRRYTAAELRTKAERAGFRVTRMTSFVSLLLPAMALSRFKRRARYDLAAELKVPPPVNAAFEKALDLERALIRAGVSFPAGGSLLLVARRR